MTTFYLALAQEGKADHLVTGDKSDLLSLETFNGIPIIRLDTLFGKLLKVHQTNNCASPLAQLFQPSNSSTNLRHNTKISEELADWPHPSPVRFYETTYFTSCASQSAGTSNLPNIRYKTASGTGYARFLF